MIDFLLKIRKALWLALAHDVLNTAKATAYSSMLMLFPALLVITTLLAQAPQGTRIVKEMRVACEQFVPADTMQLLQFSFQNSGIHSTQLVVSAATLSLLAALGLMLSLMAGFRRAYRLPKGEWGFWSLRIRALLMVPVALIPLSLATLAVMFGHQYEVWMIDNAGHELRAIVLFFWRMVRWAIALGTVVTVFSSIYHFGIPCREHWRHVLPGAITAALFWFPSTLFFGWYVSRVATYAMVYGSLGAAIATMVWLYLSSFSFLFGAEINGVLYRERMRELAHLRDSSRV